MISKIMKVEDKLSQIVDARRGARLNRTEVNGKGITRLTRGAD